MDVQAGRVLEVEISGIAGAYKRAVERRQRVAEEVRALCVEIRVCPCAAMPGLATGLDVDAVMDCGRAGDFGVGFGNVQVSALCLDCYPGTT